MALSSDSFLNQPPPMGKTCICGEIITGGDPYPSRLINGQEVCGDCQSDEMSKSIDWRPIGRPMSHI